ncbi:putative aminoglycoside phosphotransferase, protein kinase-like domain superfamily [Plasmopara halstedii]
MIKSFFYPLKYARNSPCSKNLPPRGTMVTLFCAVVGKEGSTFSIDIDTNKSVDHLNDAIMAKKPNAFKGFDADELELSLAKKGAGWLPSAELSAIRKGEDIPGFEKISLVDTEDEPYSTYSLRVVLETNQMPPPQTRQIHVLVLVPDQLSVSAVATVSIKKRKLTDISDLITPSSFAKCKGSGSWVKWLKKLNGQIECHRIERSDDVTPIPVVLLNKTFARFEENCKVIKFCQNDCEFVNKLCYGLSTPYDNEATFAERARQLLTAYLLGDNPVSTITPATTLLLNLECKLQKGDGGGDPTMQNVAYYIKNLPLVINRQFPCFLVDICGPFMSVFGIVNTSDEDAICEPLVMSSPLLFFDNEWLMVSLARMCAFLKAAIQELTNLCYEFSASRQNRAFVERDGVDISFQYLEVVQRYVFKARQAMNNVIIKFAKRYGREVHDYCSNAGFAPELLFCEYLPNGWVFIVMEQLSLCPLRHANGMIVRDQLLKIENLLKDGSFVHGDLREQNVMWDTSKNRVVLIDFDWSGRDGVDTYPPFMNGEIAWPAGAACGEPLRVAHDAYWIASIAARLT